MAEPGEVGVLRRVGLAEAAVVDVQNAIDQRHNAGVLSA
jgi:hypothetical protein